MNKEITIYELLGLIKDEKVPKKIKYEDKVYIYSGDDYSVNGTRKDWLFSEPYDTKDLYLSEFMDSVVQIIEEDNKIEKLEITVNNGGAICLRNENGTLCGMNKHSIVMAKKINEIIDKLNSMEVE